MISVLIAVRDFLLALALSWVGVTIEQPAPPAAQPPAAQHAASTPACGDGQMCAAQRPQFDSLTCNER